MMTRLKTATLALAVGLMSLSAPSYALEHEATVLEAKQQTTLTGVEQIQQDATANTSTEASLDQPSRDEPSLEETKPKITPLFSPPNIKELKKQQAAEKKEKLSRKIVINIPSRKLHLIEDGSVVKSFFVGVGRPGFMTPVGKHQVIRKILNPGWENPYKAKGASKIRPGGGNPLGTRWIGFKQTERGEFGIHGTNRPGSVGKFSSHGCVRMQISQAEFVFSQVELGTPVEVTYELVEINRKGNQVLMTVYPDTFKQGRPSMASVKKRILTSFPTAVINDQALAQALRTQTQKTFTAANY